jgi:sulfite reductase alpha subunit-like flavoprotein
MEDEDEEVLRKLVVLYGSQTGTAEEVAERIGREARRRFIVPNVLAMDDYNIVCTLYLSIKTHKVQYMICRVAHIVDATPHRAG